MQLLVISQFPCFTYFPNNFIYWIASLARRVFAVSHFILHAHFPSSSFLSHRCKHLHFEIQIKAIIKSLSPFSGNGINCQKFLVHVRNYVIFLIIKKKNVNKMQIGKRNIILETHRHYNQLLTITIIITSSCFFIVG